MIYKTYFKDRIEAGEKLAEKLLKYKGQDVVVLALPRGGVPIAFEVAKALQAPMDVFVARKIGSPHNPEVGIGAVTEDGVIIVDSSSLQALGITQEELKSLAAQEMEEVQRRVQLYRNGYPRLEVKNKIVILVDDGLATGVTAIAAVRSLLLQSPDKIVFAAPVCAHDTAEFLKHREVDELVCLYEPEEFTAVGVWYEDFSQLMDEEVLAVLEQARAEVGNRGGAS